MTGTHSTLMGESQQMVQTPQNPVTDAQVQAAVEQVAQRLQVNGGRLGMRFLTPTRIIYDKKLVHRPHFRPLFQRLVERVYELQRTFGHDGAAGVAGPACAGRSGDAGAGRLRLVGRARPFEPAGTSAATGWLHRGGLVPAAAIWAPLLPWLVWGMSTHVGKNAVKGSGWYTLEWGQGELGRWNRPGRLTMVN